ncbi:1,2-phenylacetyl-CoA epoxidase, subunit B [Phycisphaerae bacterium RAS1]|nr:1,2-phenylacetyl-CoA epoxidase, subunit B [Phycisphaerae bacterium RAS1]
MSKIRENVPLKASELESPAEGDLKAYEVFIQLERGKPHVHAGGLDAPDDEMALLFAREHYGRDQPCVQVWVVPRDAIRRTNYDEDVVFRLSDQSYRQAKGYLDVRKKWETFRARKAVDEYQKDDLKEAF